MTVSDAQGRYTLRDVAPWRQEGPRTSLCIRAAGFETGIGSRVTGQPGERFRTTITLFERARTVEGTVRDAQGRPVAGATVAFAPLSRHPAGSVSPDGFTVEAAPALAARTDASGIFRCQRVPLESGSLLVRADGFLPCRVPLGDESKTGGLAHKFSSFHTSSKRVAGCELV
jgi:hypothetical protein